MDSELARLKLIMQALLLGILRTSEQVISLPISMLVLLAVVYSVRHYRPVWSLFL